MKKFSLKSSFLLVALLLFFVAVSPAWAGDTSVQGDGAAIASLDSSVEATVIAFEDVRPYEMQSASIAVFADPPMIPAIAMTSKGKILPSQHTKKSFLVSRGYTRPPDLLSLTAGKYGKQMTTRSTHGTGFGVFMKAIGVRHSRSDLIRI